ncbi:hypothetical protein NKI80_28490 [Mesorhizobium sp. M0387]|uniref:hypothetical protein n=1 Tax=Mesorhizobium sp. M0387 TaxID=2956940 RepID=UPI003334E907
MSFKGSTPPPLDHHQVRGPAVADVAAAALGFHKHVVPGRLPRVSIGSCAIVNKNEEHIPVQSRGIDYRVPILFTAGKLETTHVPTIATESEQPEIYATIRRELPAIHRAVSKMGKQMRGLSPLSQKAAIAELTAIWCLANYPA